MTPVWLGFGSNLGDREDNLRAALQHLQEPRLRLRRVSSFRETEAAGGPPQPAYLNQVAQFDSEMFPLQLLRHCLSVECQLGRRRLGPNTPRTIDIDVLLMGAIRVATQELTVPHPRYRQRRFVLEPLAELAPDLRDPSTGRTVRQMLQNTQLSLKIQP